jgi:hypothetical protein
MLILTNGYGQVTLGVGIVKIEFDGTTVIDFYDKPTDKTQSKRIEFFNDPAINSFNIKNLDKERTWLNPEKLWLDYFQFAFRCKTKTSEWLEVVVNEGTGQTLWIKQTKEIKFLTWENYLKDMFGVTRLENEKQKIRTSRSDNGQEIKYEGTDCFRVKTLKGEWIEIFTPDHCDAYGGKTQIKSGWIKWKRGNKLLIQYYTTS